MRNNLDPLVSVYITNKNYGKYIETAVKSVLKQSYKNIELVILDDASTDGSQKIIKKYEEKKLCRVIYNKKSKGLIKSSNIAIKATNGRYVIRLDADDYLDQNALTLMVNKIEKDSNIALVYSDYYLIDEKKNILSLEKQLSRDKNYMEHKPVLGACCLIRKSSIFSVNLYDERFNRQDGYDLWYKLIKNFKFAHIPLPLFFYRRHSKNLTKNKNKLFKTRTKILRKFSQKKQEIKKLTISCVIPVRGKNIDNLCTSLDKINNKPLIFYTIEEALKVNEFKNIIVTTADNNLIKVLKKKYKNKIMYHKRSQKLSEQNLDYKQSVIKAINKFNKNKIDVVAILTIENPQRKFFYIKQALSNLIIHGSDLVIGTLPDIENNYYKYSKKGIELVSNKNNNSLKLEKNIILKDVGAFSIYNYDSYLNNRINKTTNIVLDEQHSINILNKSDILIMNKSIQKFK